MKYLYILSLLNSCLLLNSCKVGEALEETTNTAENIIEELMNNLDGKSDDWEQLFRDAIAQLPQDAKDIISNDLNNMANGLIASTGTELRCNVDFIRNRLIQDLQELKNKLLDRHPIIREPHVCQAVPSSIRMSLNPNDRIQINFFGYDFLDKSLQVKLYSDNGVTDHSTTISKTSNYQANMNLGDNGVRLDDKSNKIAIVWDGNIISEVSIIQDAVVPCISKDVNSGTYGPVTLVPSSTRGDREFDGNGPKVYTSVKLRIVSNNSKIAADLHTKFEETKKDWTTGEKKRTINDFYIAPTGWKIEKILSDPIGSFRYTDNNHTTDTKNVNDGPLRKIVAVGDRKGKDIGSGSQVIFHFNRIKVRLRKSNDCGISAGTMGELIALGSIDDNTKTQFEVALKTMRND